MKVANGAVHRFFMDMGREIVTDLMFVPIQGMTGLNGKGKQKGERKYRREEYLICFLFDHPYSIEFHDGVCWFFYALLFDLSNRNPNRMDCNIFFSKAQKNSNCPNIHP